jgi:hypothetical protein
MIDTTTEKLIRLHEAAALVPASRGAKATHISTVLRWILTGAKGPGGVTVRLEAVRAGRKWLTSREAVQRFLEALTPDPEAAQSTPVPRSPGRRQRASERAARELEKMGL